MLEYDPDTGCLFWRHRPRELFETLNAFKSWNTKFAGRETFHFIDRHGYNYGMLFRKTYKKHRIVWLMCYGQLPDKIDHVNGDRKDNRLINLRSVTTAENCKNLGRSKSNTSGVTGVNFVKSVGKWNARICCGGIRVNLGYYSEMSEAVSARKNAELTFGFHPNHGKMRLQR